MQRSHEKPITADSYDDVYQFSVTQPEVFWGEVAREELEWFTPFEQALSAAPTVPPVWFQGGVLNITNNCLDRHIAAGNGARVAYHYTNEFDQKTSISYQELLTLVCQLANALTAKGIAKGSRVVIYMPLCIEQIALVVACARVGAIHSVVYAGFSAEAVATRIADLDANLICTADFTQRNGKHHELITVIRAALELSKKDLPIVVLKRNSATKLQKNEQSYEDFKHDQPTTFASAHMQSTDPLFVLYTSGTTGKPKGIVHTCGGYSVYAHFTAKVNFDFKPDRDVFWCTADVGWITGHAYTVYGALSNGVTSLLYEGSPAYPAPDRWWQLIEQYGVTKFYTSPTAIRTLMQFGPSYPAQHDLSALEIIGSVGEPLNPSAWQWISDTLCSAKTALIDTWWQTESGGHLIGGLPFFPAKKGTTGKPFFGIKPLLLDEKNKIITQPNTVGTLVIASVWPGALAECWHNPTVFKNYWHAYAPQNYFYTGDLARCDADGYVTIVGRADDVINVSGVRLSTAEIENVLTTYPGVVEAGVAGSPDEITGQQVVASLIVAKDCVPTPELITSIQQHVKTHIGYFAVPKKIEIVTRLPKTRSGKIMRRVLRAQAAGTALGDTSTLETD